MNTFVDFAVPDPETVLRREDQRLSRRSGDDPLPADQLRAFATAVRAAVVEPLTAELAKRTAAPQPAPGPDLQDECARLADELASARADHARQVDTLRQQINQQAADIDDARSARRQLEEATTAVASLQAERDRLRSKIEGLKSALAAAEQSAAKWEAEFQQRADDEVGEQAALAHRHYYPADSPGQTPGPCACGHPYPRAHIANRWDEVAPSPAEPWAPLLDQIRAEVGTWPEPERTR
ncbi:hypothetical protein [Amycolatopsis thermoflava]|uniref:hypothetical protein n=1 Tax=Amycolatopsis thermoflava TaxID=84480 RepID=UPI0037FA5747